MILIDDGNRIKDLFANFQWSSGLIILDYMALEFSNILIDELYVFDVKTIQKLSGEMKAKINALKMIIVLYDQREDLWDVHKTITIPIFPYSYHEFKEKTSRELIQKQFEFLQHSMVEQQVLKTELISINSELNETLGFIEEELSKVKKINHRFIPKRISEAQGVDFSSKFFAGKKMGGEFHDLITQKQNHLILMTNMNSYIASSLFLNRFNDFKEKVMLSGDVIDDFIANVDFELKELGKNKNKNLIFEFLTLFLDGKKNSLVIRWHGDYSLFSQHAESDLLSNLKQGKFDYIVNKPQKFLLLSPGFKRNWKDLVGSNLEEVICSYLQNESIRSVDILDELFFELNKSLKKSGRGDLLTEDATAIFININELGSLHVV